MILAQHSTTIVHLFRVLFTVIDRVVYWAIMEIYNLIDQITRINIFDESTLSEFSTRIYTIIGVLMLFKLAFSIISYIVDPDKLLDSKKGFTSLVKNIIIMLALIVTVPLIFKYAMALQYVVVSDNTIGRLITGKEGGSTANVGDNMSVAILSGFIHPDSGVAEGCENWSQTCEDALAKYNLNTTYHNAYFGERGYNYLLELGMSSETMGDGNYVIIYNVILSTLVGGFTAWILLMFCIDIAVRIVKLGFLQLIAPIPIVTYMDDGGQGVFKKWVKACTSTYADLFIRLAAINFAIYVISVFLISSDTDKNALLGTFKMCEWSFNAGTLTAVCDKKPGVFVRLFLILGTLMFAKQLPKLIEEITGLKLDGGFTLNPMKKLQEVPLIGGAAAKGLGLAGRTAGNLTAGLAGGIWGATAGRALGAAGGAIKNAYDGSKLQKIAGGAGDIANTAYGVADNFMGNRLSRIGTDVSGTMSSFRKKREGIDAATRKKVLGQQLWRQYSQTASGKNMNGESTDESKAKQRTGAERYSGIIRNREMAAKAYEMDVNKDLRDAASSRLTQMKLDYERGVEGVTSKMVADAEVDALKAKGAYDKSKSDFDLLKTMNASDAERYDAYMAAADSAAASVYANDEKVRDRIMNYSTGSNATSSSSSSSANASSGPNPLDNDPWNNSGSYGGPNS